jgi:hypothetical protein
MHARTASLFQRLRSHKGAWLLVLAAIMIKVAAATVCVLDGPKVVALATSQAVAAQADATHASSATGDEDCLLGEVGGCHCACAHAATLPATAPFVASLVIPPTISAHPPVSPSPRVSPSPLRPPIA